MLWALTRKMKVSTSNTLHTGQTAFLRRDLRQELLASLVCLQLVNVLHKDALILEHITLGPQVEAVVPERQQKGKKH